MSGTQAAFHPTGDAKIHWFSLMLAGGDDRIVKTPAVKVFP
jgi:hypothetical protein